MTGAVIGALRTDITLGTATLEAGASKAQRVFDALQTTMSGVAAAAERTGGRFSNALKDGTEKAARSAAAFAVEMDRLQAKFDPLFAASRRYQTELTELNRAQQLGVVTGARYDAALENLNRQYLAVGSGAAGAAGHVQTLSVQSRALSAQSGNIAAQFQDIAVQLQAGTSPFTIALQQGTQLNGVFTQMGGGIGTVGAALKGAFMSLLSPVSLVTIGVIALGGYIVQAFSSGKDATESFDDALSRAEKSLSQLKDTAAIFSAEGIQKIIDKYGVLNAEILTFIERQRESAVFGAMRDAQAVAAKLKDEFGGALDKIGEFGKSGSLAMGQITKETGLSMEQVRDLKAAFDQLYSDADISQKIAALTQIREILAQSGLKGTALYDEFLRAEDVLRQMNVEGAKSSGWLGAMVDGATTLGTKLWDAAKAAAAVRDAQFAERVGPDERGSQRKQEISAGEFKRDEAIAARLKDMKGSGGASKAQKETNDLDREAESLKKRLATATERYQTEVGKLGLMLKKGLITQKQYDLAVADLNKTLADGVPLVGDIADAWGEFVARGFKDFKGFAEAIGASFRKLIADMISTALRNRIVLSMGVTGGGTGAALAGQVGGQIAGGGGGGLLSGLTGKLFGSFGTQGAGIFGGLAGGTGLLGGLGNALSGGLGGIFNIGSNAALAGGGLMAGLGAALPIIGIGAALFSFFKTKKKILDTGVSGQLSLGGTYASDFQDIQKTKFFGLSKKKSTQTTFNAALTEALGKSVIDAAAGITSLGSSIGVSADLSKAALGFRISGQGLSGEQMQQALQEQLAKFADDLAETMLGGEAWKNLAKDGETASQTLGRLSESIKTVNTASEALGWNMFAISKQGAAAASAFVDLLGGLDGFKTLTDSYYSDFYSAQEKTAFTTKKLAESFQGLGLTLPDTRDQFRALVDQADKAGNTKLVSELLKLSPAFASITKSADDLADTLQNELKKRLDALSENDFASALDFGRARAAIAYGGGLMVAGSATSAAASQLTAGTVTAGQTTTAILSDRIDALATQIAAHVEAVRRYVTRWDMDGLPPTRTVT